ncbi:MULTISPECIES: hypothetical protein [Methylomonas]|uniref:hypothetical protein n=1 Tax=Methylomonas TaxID=416 RepID=UPI0007C944EB|nr:MULTISPECIES: hypothetical protein [Methylomonas]ANE54483.1 hypothetical protein AYM39_04290 [Methylomonas sp. DH-1]WNB76785.1 hypothetical protein RI210_04225 [Methylomonas koyamae]
MASVVPVCNGVLTVDLTGVLRCSVDWQTIATPAFFDFSQIDPAIMGEAVGAGFIIGGSAIWFAWGCRIIVNILMGKKP